MRSRKLISLILITTVITFLMGCSNTNTPVIPTLSPVKTLGLDTLAIVHVARVIDGDTIEVEFESGQSDRVRIIGVDTPEIFSPNQSSEYGNITDLDCLDKWGDAATQYARDILNNKTVKLVQDPQVQERDYYDRLLAYIEINGQDFGEMLLSRGYARVYVEGESSRKNNYLQLGRNAKADSLGLWSCDASVQTTTQTPTSQFRFNPNGPDRDCGDFYRWTEAQSFYEAAGGPYRDPHRLDGDKDGIACESLR